MGQTRDKTALLLWSSICSPKRDTGHTGDATVSSAYNAPHATGPAMDSNRSPADRKVQTAHDVQGCAVPQPSQPAVQPPPPPPLQHQLYTPQQPPPQRLRRVHLVASPPYAHHHDQRLSPHAQHNSGSTRHGHHGGALDYGHAANSPRGLQWSPPLQPPTRETQGWHNPAPPAGPFPAARLYPSPSARQTSVYPQNSTAAAQAAMNTLTSTISTRDERSVRQLLYEGNVISAQAAAMITK